MRKIPQKNKKLLCSGDYLPSANETLGMLSPCEYHRHYCVLRPCSPHQRKKTAVHWRLLTHLLISYKFSLSKERLRLVTNCLTEICELIKISNVVELLRGLAVNPLYVTKPCLIRGKISRKWTISSTEPKKCKGGRPPSASFGVLSQLSGSSNSSLSSALRITRDRSRSCADLSAATILTRTLGGFAARATATSRGATHTSMYVELTACVLELSGRVHHPG